MQIRQAASTWEIPAYNLGFYQGRQQATCIIIPVINEGERIATLLTTMYELKIKDIADIIIVDGGSTDGSLNITDLQSKGVAGLIEKTGPGKLSAQLRCGYSFALLKDYDHIITIDGNNKDDPQAIPQFITALNKGTAFVQGSRFVNGGKAENTPKLREIAIRLIHAPLLRFFSGFKWTDTTQGFRGYNKQVLLDPQIAPFRNIFSSYELLAYLSYRAPKIGYSCIELPTTRRYPTTGKTPTKINGIRGNLSLLIILIRVCLGFYNPK